MNNRFYIFFIFFFNCVLNIQAQYSADFSTPNRGIVQGGNMAGIYTYAATSGNLANIPGYNVAGMNWTLTPTSTDPYTIDFNQAPQSGNSYAQTLSSGFFETRRTQGDICVTSPILNIAGLGSVNINMAVSRIGTGTYISVDDDIEFKYILNSGTPITSGSLTGGPGTSASWAPMVTGNTLRILACMAQNHATEDYRLTQFSTNKGVPLPIRLLSFFAKTTPENTVILNWKTATETNNKGFDIETSKDGVNFQVLEFVKGRGTTSEKQNYTFTHRLSKNESGIQYYRLKQMDFDGQFEYSKTIVVRSEGKQNSIAVYPNPSNGLYTIVPNEKEEIEQISLMSITGQSLDVNISNNQLDLTNEPTGVYFLQVNGQNIKLIKY